MSARLVAARLFFESVRHTRPRQLLARLRLMARRRLLETLPPLGRAGRPLAPRRAPALTALPPQPILPPRAHLSRSPDGQAAACFLNLELPLVAPMDWRPPGYARGTHLESLHLHGMEYLEAVDDRLFHQLVEDWIARVPPYGRGYWRHGWGAFATSIRVVVWMQQLARRGISASSESGRRIGAAIAAQVRFLERNLERDLGGNHLIKNIKALLWAGRFFSGPAARRWHRRGARLLGAELDEQILPDGLHFERSPAYHCQVLADLLECVYALDESALRNRALAAAGRMVAALGQVVHPDGRVSQFNDGGLHMAYPPDVCAAAYGELGGRAPARGDWTALPDAGYFGSRAGDDFVLVDCGPIGPDHLPAHGHGDILAFEWSLAGRRCIVDTGVFEYNPGARRRRSRSTSAHNTVTVDGADQCEFWRSFRVGRRARVRVHRYARDGASFELDGSHDGYRRLPGAPVHRRVFVCHPRRIEVHDRIEGGRGQRVQARLLLAPGFTTSRVERGLAISDGERHALLTSQARLSTVPAPWFPDFGVERDSRQIVLDYGEAPCAAGFVLEAC